MNSLVADSRPEAVQEADKRLTLIEDVLWSCRDKLEEFPGTHRLWQSCEEALEALGTLRVIVKAGQYLRSQEEA